MSDNLTPLNEVITVLDQGNRKLAGLAAAVKSAADAVAVHQRKLDQSWSMKIADAQKALDVANAGAAECRAKLAAAQDAHDRAKAEHDAYKAKLEQAKAETRAALAAFDTIEN
jgi:D-arabinose 1-dehydrogenase-like Zn-dependent alcohol dehydrogenase